jgi:hypothetical protein
MMFPSLLRPKSRGVLTLASADVNDNPVIDTNYLSHPDDMATLVEGLKWIKSLEDTDAFKEHGLKMLPPDVTFCGDHKPLSDAYWECHARDGGQTRFAKMSQPFKKSFQGFLLNYPFSRTDILSLTVVVLAELFG